MMTAATPTRIAAVFLALSLITPVPFSYADKAGPSDPARFNSVDTWYGHVRLSVFTRYRPDSTGCSSVEETREEHVDASVFLHLATPETLPPGAAGETASGGSFRVIWGAAGPSSSGLVTGTITKHIREISKRSCETYRENLVTEGQETSRGGNAMFFLMPSMIQMMTGGWLYGFTIAPESLPMQRTGTRSFLTPGPPAVWQTEQVNEDAGTDGFLIDPAPWLDESTVGTAETGLRMQRNAKKLLDNMPQMSGFFDEEMRREMQEAMAEAEEVVKEEEQEEEQDFEPAWASVPESGMVLSGRQQKKLEDEGTTTEVTLEWLFRPQGELHYELEVEIENYDAWLPQGDMDPEKAGATAVIHARLLDPRNGRPADVRAKKIIYELQEASREKGTAMNYPLDSPDRRPDLRFEKDANPHARFEVKNEGLIIEDAGGDISESKVVLSSFDWGGIAMLRVEAVLEGPEGAEERVQGYLKGDPSKMRIELPKRKSPSWIAEKWKTDTGTTGQADGSDEDKKPAGDGHKGDGLTLYEEYRGFYILDPKTNRPVHIRGNPEQKELFIMNLIKDSRAEEGIKLFQKESEIEVHRVDETMMDRKKRVINVHRHADAWLVDQHGLVAVELPDQDSPQAQGLPPGNPQFCDQIAMPPAAAKGWTREYIYKGAKVNEDIYAPSMAHEIGHCVNVTHHGYTDVWWVEWEFGKDEDGMTVLQEWENGVGNGTPTVIFPFFEGRGSAMTDIVNRRAKAGEPLMVYVGKWGGEHSGNEQCFMRYDRARAYIREGRPANFRYVIYPESELTGRKLCSKQEDDAGGVNDVNRQPWPRYGPASEGNCKGQLCISDVYQHKDR